MTGFRSFLLRGNVVDLAIAVAIGAAFTAVVTAFVAAVISPLASVLTGGAGDASARSAKLAGVEFPYGLLIQAVFNFIIVAAVIYFLVLKPVQRLMERYKTEPEPQTQTKTCPECLSSIPEAASRCAFCAVEQPLLTH